MLSLENIIYFIKKQKSLVKSLIEWPYFMTSSLSVLFIRTYRINTPFFINLSYLIMSLNVTLLKKLEEQEVTIAT